MDFACSSTDWISQFEMEDYGHGWAHLQIPPFHSVFEPNDSDSGERAAKQAKRNSFSWSSSSGSSAVISFGSSSSAFQNDQQLPQYDIKPKLELPVSGDENENELFARSGVAGWKRAASGSPATVCSREHVIAERMRREKLTQRFILLSSLLPGLKKLDKASVLGEAARYLKELQEQVKTLEEQITQPSVDSVLTDSRKPKVSSPIQEDPNPGSSSSSNEEYDGSSCCDPLPEIEARFSDKDVLINMHCQTKQDLLPRVLNELQKLHLSVVNCNSMPFGKSATVITIVAKMNDGFSATKTELVSRIRHSLQSLTYFS